MPAQPNNPGNRRRGATRGQPGRTGQRRWSDDPLILRRVELLGNLWDHPRSVQLQAVNTWLERQGENPISMNSLQIDRGRFKELLRQRVADSAGVKGHLEQLQRLHDEMWRRLRQIPDPYGNPASAVAAVILRAIEDSAKLDGSWGAGGLEINLQVDTSSFGRTPQQQLAAGDISEEEYLTALRVLHRHTNLEAGTRRGPVIEGSARPLAERAESGAGAPGAPSGPQIRRGGSERPSGPSLPRRGRMADDIPLPVMELDGAELDEL